MKRLSLAAALISLAACGSVGAKDPSARLLSARVAYVGVAWQARVSLSDSSAHPSLVYAGRTARMRRNGSAWRATVKFGRPGRFPVAIRVGSRMIALGSVTVGYRVTQPIRIEAESGPSLLVADGSGNAILRLNTRTGLAAKVVSLPRAFSVARGGDGAVFAVGDEKLYRLEGRTLRLLADLRAYDPLDVAPGDDGFAYVATYGQSILRVAPDGTVSTYAEGFDRPHGIAIGAGGVLYVADTNTGTVKRIARDRSVTTVASGLSEPSDVLVEAGGSLLVVEPPAGRVTRIDKAGGKTTLIDGVGLPISVTAAVDGTLFVSLLEHGFAIGRVDQSRRALVRVSR